MSGTLRFIYLMDPQCGWCFGYARTIREIIDRLADNPRVRPELVTGVLFNPALETDRRFADEKRPIAERVSRRFGVRFSGAYFDNVLASGRLDSLPPCQIINAVQLLSTNNNDPAGRSGGLAAFDIAGKLIEAAFTQGRNISDLSVCLEIAQQAGYPANELRAETGKPELADMTRRSFEFARCAGTGFPSLFIGEGESVRYLGGSGLDADAVWDAVRAALE